MSHNMSYSWVPRRRNMSALPVIGTHRLSSLHVGSVFSVTQKFLGTRYGLNGGWKWSFEQSRRHGLHGLWLLFTALPAVQATSICDYFGGMGHSAWSFPGLKCNSRGKYFRRDKQNREAPCGANTDISFLLSGSTTHFVAMRLIPCLFWRLRGEIWGLPVIPYSVKRLRQFPNLSFMKVHLK